MKTNPERDRSISAWLEAEAPDRAPQELLEASRDRIRMTQQRRSYWPVRRDGSMNTILRLGGLAAAVIVLAVAGTAFLVSGGINGPTAAPSTRPSAGVINGTSPPPTGPAPTLLPGEFTACVPSNGEFKAGTDISDVVTGPDGDVTIQRRRGFTWMGGITATDQRFSGTHYYSWDGDSYTLASGDAGQSAWAEGHRIETDAGAWNGSSSGLTMPEGTQNSVIILTGEGAYEGLTAVLYSFEGGCFFDYRGIVTEIPAPPVPYTGD
jgi:hypothetical protein